MGVVYRCECISKNQGWTSSSINKEEEETNEKKREPK
jgi:hypothetical protein